MVETLKSFYNNFNKYSLELAPFVIAFFAVVICFLIVSFFEIILDIELSKTIKIISYAIFITSAYIRAFWLNVFRKKSKKITLIIANDSIINDLKLFNKNINEIISIDLNKFDIDIIIPNRSARYLFNYFLKSYPNLNKYQQWYIEKYYKWTKSTILIFGHADFTTFKEKECHSINPKLYFYYDPNLLDEKVVEIIKSLENATLNVKVENEKEDSIRIGKILSIYCRTSIILIDYYVHNVEISIDTLIDIYSDIEVIGLDETLLNDILKIFKDLTTLIIKINSGELQNINDEEGYCKAEKILKLCGLYLKYNPKDLDVLNDKLYWEMSLRIGKFDDERDLIRFAKDLKLQTELFMDNNDYPLLANVAYLTLLAGNIEFSESLYERIFFAKKSGIMDAKDTEKDIYQYMVNTKKYGKDFEIVYADYVFGLIHMYFKNYDDSKNKALRSFQFVLNNSSNKELRKNALSKIVKIKTGRY